MKSVIKKDDVKLNDINCDVGINGNHLENIEI